MDRGACASIYEREMMCDPKRVEEAKAVCAGCTVQAECYDWAVDQGQEWCVHAGIQFNHKVKQQIAASNRKVRVMAEVLLTVGITDHGNRGDIVDLDDEVALVVVGRGYGELVGDAPVAAPVPEATEPEVTDDPDVDEILSDLPAATTTATTATTASGVSFSKDLPDE